MDFKNLIFDLRGRWAWQIDRQADRHRLIDSSSDAESEYIYITLSSLSLCLSLSVIT